MTVTTHTASRSMDRARHAAREHSAAYDAGYHGVSWDEHRDHRADTEDPYQVSLRAAHDQGRTDRLAETRPEIPEDVRARLRSRQERAARTGTTRRATAGYLARAGRSLRSQTADIPTPSGGGTWLGIIVGAVALILLFVALNHAGAVATAVSGVARAARWLISPSTLPI